MDLQIIHRKRIASVEEVTEVWGDLASDVKNGVINICPVKHNDDNTQASMETLPSAVEKMELGRKESSREENEKSPAISHDHNYGIDPGREEASRKETMAQIAHNYHNYGTHSKPQAIEPEKEKPTLSIKEEIDLAIEATEDMKLNKASNQIPKKSDGGAHGCPEGCQCDYCQAKARIKALPRGKLQFNISKANMSNVTRNGKTGSRFQCNEANGYLDAVHGIPTPLINLRVSVKGGGKGTSN